jgi:hypothetical protein
MKPETLPLPDTLGSFYVITSDDAAIRECVQRISQDAQPERTLPERRSAQRVPYVRLITLTLLNADELVPRTEPIQVVGKHLSPLGLDFFHHDPITERYGVASLEIGSNQSMHLLMKITWCRFLRPNWYDSGGRFIKQVGWNGATNGGAHPRAELGGGRFFKRPGRNKLSLECFE